MKQKQWLSILAVIVATYWATRLVNLTMLPVFADEAIYIRWAQLMNQDFGRYAFFPLQDGKPPLQMWLLTQFIKVAPEDPLLGSRSMSVGFGFLNLLLVGYLTRLLTGKKRPALVAMAMYVVLPFSLFFDRMGLIDPILVTFTLMAVIGLVQILKNKPAGIVMMGAGLGMAFWSKTSALFLGLPLIWLAYMGTRAKKSGKGRLMATVGAGIMMGLVMFGTLRVSPSFPALFSRSGDFTFSMTESWEGERGHIWGNVQKFAKWLGVYMTWPVAALWLSVPLMRKKPKGRGMQIGLSEMLVAAVWFMLPFAIFGRVVASRYLLPVMVFLLPVAAIQLVRWQEKSRVMFAVIAAGMMWQSVWFGRAILTDPGKMPLAHEDEVQYLTEWSAGYGIPEVRDLIRERAVDKRVVVATEGYFGTLPDGLLMYFDQSVLIKNLEIYGIGQPISGLPDELIEKAKVDETYLVVNSHRLLMELPNEHLRLVEAYARPLDGPSLLLFKVIGESGEE